MKQQARPRELRTGKSHNGLEKAHSLPIMSMYASPYWPIPCMSSAVVKTVMISKIGLRQRKRFWRRLRRKTLEAKLARMCD